MDFFQSNPVAIDHYRTSIRLDATAIPEDFAPNPAAFLPNNVSHLQNPHDRTRKQA